MVKVVLALTYLPDRPHSACSLQTCHSFGVFPPGPGAYEGYGPSSPPWWKKDVCILQEEKTKMTIQRDGRHFTDALVLMLYVINR